MDYKDAWNLIKAITKEKQEETDSPDRRFAYSHILGLMESYEKEIATETQKSTPD